MSIFTSKKIWNFFIKNQLTKSDLKRTWGKCPTSCQLGNNENKVNILVTVMGFAHAFEHKSVWVNFLQLCTVCYVVQTCLDFLCRRTWSHSCFIPNWIRGKKTRAYASYVAYEGISLVSGPAWSHCLMLYLMHMVYTTLA